MRLNLKHEKVLRPLSLPHGFGPSCFCASNLFGAAGAG